KLAPQSAAAAVTERCASIARSERRRPQAPRIARNENATNTMAQAASTVRREAESAASSGTSAKQIAANDRIPPVHAAKSVINPGGENGAREIGALRLPGAGDLETQENGRDQPAERRPLDRARRAARREITRQAGDGAEPADQPRSHEGVVPRGRRSVAARRR